MPVSKPLFPLIQVLMEADPSYPDRVFKYDALMASVEQGGNNEVALAGLQELEGSEHAARAVLSAMTGTPLAPNAVRKGSSCASPDPLPPPFLGLSG